MSTSFPLALRLRCFMEMSAGLRCTHGTRRNCTKKTPSYCLMIRLHVRTQLLTGATLLSSVGLVTPPTEIVAIIFSLGLLGKL